MKPRRILTWMVLGFFAVFVAGAFAVYAARKPIAAFVVQTYLLRHGVPSTIAFDRLERGGLTARVIIGADMPSFSAEILDVTLDYPGLFALPTIGTVKLVRPVLRASYDGETLSFGALQPLVDQALSQEPEGPGPSFVVEDGTLFLTTPNGALQFNGDGDVLQGRLRALDVSLASTMLGDDRLTAEIAGGSLSARIAGDAVDGDLRLRIDSLATRGDMAMQTRGLDAAVSLKGLEWQTGDNTLDFQIAGVEATINAANATRAQDSAEAIETRFVLSEIQGALAGSGLGDVGGPMRFSLARGMIVVNSGPLRVATSAAAQFRSDAALERVAGSYENGNLRVTAAVTGTQEMAALDAGNQSAARLAIRTALDPLDISFGARDWSIGGPAQIGLDATGLRHRLPEGDITLRSLETSLNGTGILTGTGFDGALAGPVAINATMPRTVAASLVSGYLPLLTVEPKIMTAAVEAVREASFRIPSLSIASKAGKLSFAANGATTISSASGARFAFSPQGGRALVQGDTQNIAGAIGLQIRGGDLPDTQLTVSAYRARFQDSGMILTASAAVDTTLDIAGLNRVHLSGAGDFTSAREGTSIRLTRCADVSFDSYVNGGIARVSDSKVRLCANAAQPFLTATEAGWRLNAAWSEASARFDQAESRMSGANGRVALMGDANGPSGGHIDLDAATLSDLQAMPRFLPVNLGGALDLKDQDWTGVLALSVKNRRFATLTLAHALETGAGKADIVANVDFNPAQFQPTDISPPFASFGTRVRGRMDFTGRLAWDSEGIASDGRLRLANVDLQTQLGAVNGIAGELTLTSLMPVELAPSQTVTINRIDWLVPLEQASARFSYDATAVRLESASATVSGGRVSLDPLTLSFAPDAITAGTLHLDNIELAPLLAAAGLAERVRVTSGISGTIPFSSGPNGLSFRNGTIAADTPGRLSIAREALTTAVNTGAGGQAPPNAVQDFAYQALESLSFEELTGMVNSTPTGRLGVLLHVRGQHDPAATQETRVGVADLLRGRAFDKPLPLPKGTPIDLTLDTSLNLNELLQSYFGSRNGTAPPAP